MTTERKTRTRSILSVQLPTSLMGRVDFVVRNTEPETVKNRSVAVRKALEAWLPGHEERLSVLGLLPKKAR